MANSERIDDIISDKAFEQLDQLLEKLGSAQDSFGKLVKSVAQTNAEINKSQSITEFNEAIKEANKGFQALETEQKKVTKARTEATKAEKEAIETAKTKLTVDENAKKLLAQQSGTLEQLIKIQLKVKWFLKRIIMVGLFIISNI
jgi:ABC-type transporter Mla subunit MlaD